MKLNTTEFKVAFYKDAKSEWRWSLIALNGNVVADSSEGYANKADCQNEWKRIQQWASAVEQGKNI
jgi:uncharacterized protein